MPAFSRLNDQGLTEQDVIDLDELTERFQLNGHEKRATRDMFADWHKGWSKVVESSQRRFNKMRRMQCADDDGMCVCCCTGLAYRFTEIDAGHFVSATKQATRFDPENVHPQSKHSNNHNLGDDAKIDYTMFMMERYGRNGINTIRAKAKTTKKWGESHLELIALNIVWKREIKHHERRLGL